MRPRMPRRLKIETPSPSGSLDPASGNPRNTVLTAHSPGNVWQNAVNETSQAAELNAGQSTVISTHLIVVPPSTMLTAGSVVTDVTEADEGVARYRISRRPALRRTRLGRPSFLAAAAVCISDMP